MRPVFETKFSANFNKDGLATTDVAKIVGLERRAEQKYDPDHPEADEEGFARAQLFCRKKKWSICWRPAASTRTISKVFALRALMVRILSWVSKFGVN